MAAGATLYHLQIELSDVDRGVYETLDLRLAQHPSESMPYLLARTLAYSLLYEEGIAFSKGGLSSTDEAPLSVRDPQGNLRVWVEIGTPSADRLHKASKASPRVVVFTQHDPRLLVREAGTREIGALLVDRRTHRVAIGEDEISLTPKEFDLLALLAEEPGAVFERSRILEQVWDPHWYGPTKTLDVHIASLRKKLGDPAWIETVRGVGFRLVDPEGE